MSGKVYKNEFTKSDGRKWIQYSRAPFPDSFEIIDEGNIRPQTWLPPTYRFNKMRGEYVAISASRNERPFLPPKEFCPLCSLDQFEKMKMEMPSKQMHQSQKNPTNGLFSKIFTLECQIKTRLGMLKWSFTHLNMNLRWPHAQLIIFKA